MLRQIAGVDKVGGGQRRVTGRLGFRAAGMAIALVFGLALATSQPSAAKEKKPATKTIKGEVLDKSENGIVGAAVELTDLTTGKKTAIYSEDGGKYQFTDLEPRHDYQVQAHYQGLASDVRKASSLDGRAIFVLYLHIPPPANSE